MSYRKTHFRPQRPRSFWSAPRIATKRSPTSGDENAENKKHEQTLESAQYGLEIIFNLNLIPRVFVPLDQQSENESSGSNHFEIAKEITE